MQSRPEEIRRLISSSSRHHRNARAPEMFYARTMEFCRKVFGFVRANPTYNGLSSPQQHSSAPSHCQSSPLDSSLNLGLCRAVAGRHRIPRRYRIPLEMSEVCILLNWEVLMIGFGYARPKGSTVLVPNSCPPPGAKPTGVPQILKAGGGGCHEILQHVSGGVLLDSYVAM